MINLDPSTFFDDKEAEVQLQVTDDDIIVKDVDDNGVPIITPREGGQRQNGRYIECNGATVSMVGTSQDNYLIVQSPNFPYYYPTYLW